VPKVIVGAEPNTLTVAVGVTMDNVPRLTVGVFADADTDATGTDTDNVPSAIEGTTALTLTVATGTTKLIGATPRGAVGSRRIIRLLLDGNEPKYIFMLIV
jgi:hypothetical protein